MAYKRKIFYAFCQGASQLGRWRLPPDEFNAFIVPLPPHDEQTAIADFLDRETAKIDGLIAEQERLIALLKEKRQAVISHAVTKGLDPNAPMRDSGVEWLGEVPAHWRISRLKHLSSHVVDCLHTTPTYEGDLIYPAIRTADLERGRLLLGQARLVSEEVYQERVQRLPPEPGDILYSREGELGMAALVPKDTKLCLGQRMMMFRTYPHVDSAYVMWLLNSDAVYQQVMSTVGGATSPHVNIADIVNFAIPLPPLHEQADIAHKIKEIASACDGLIEKSEEAISFLQERRSALISAAVTGKIDARPLAPASAEAA
jgi:type I restriction enzyme S subunit